MRRFLPEVACVLGIAGAILCLRLLVWAVQMRLDLWDVSAFVGLLLGGLALSGLAAFAALRIRRDTEKVKLAATSERLWFFWAALDFASTALLLVFVLGLVYTQSGLVRTAWHGAGRRYLSIGMARDLPGPPPQPAGTPVLPSAP